MKYIMKLVKFLGDSGLLIKGIAQTIESETKEQKGTFLSMILVTFGASFLENILAGKGVNRADQGANREGQHFECCLIL